MFFAITVASAPTLNSLLPKRWNRSHGSNTDFVAPGGNDENLTWDNSKIISGKVTFNVSHARVRTKSAGCRACFVSSSAVPASTNLNSYFVENARSMKAVGIFSGPIVCTIYLVNPRYDSIRLKDKS